MSQSSLEHQALDIMQMMLRDPSGIIRFWSQGLVRLYGFTEAEAVGKYSHDLLRTCFPRPLAELNAELMARGEWTGELVHHCSDGSAVAVASRWSICRQDGGSALVAEVNTDLSILRGAQEAQVRLAAIVENSEIAIIGKTLGSIVTSWNEAAEKTFGYTRDEMIGQPIFRLVPKPLHDEERAILRRLAAGETIRPHETTRLRKDGREIRVSLVISPIRAPSGEIIGASKMARDISEERATRARLAELQSDVTRMARIGAMGEMAAALSHELNQPITALTTYGEALVQLVSAAALDPAAVRSVANKLAQQAARTGQIIRRVRDFVSNRRAVQSTEDLGELVQDAVDLARTGLDGRGIDIRLDPGPRPIRLVLDRVQIQQVVLNLLRNAVDAVEGAAHREILVSLLTEPEIGSVTIAVRDTGSGFPAEMRTRLFQRFATSKPAGLGIGLSLSREIAQAHGGDITVTSEPGSFTTVSIILPIHVPSVAEVSR